MSFKAMLLRFLQWGWVVLGVLSPRLWRAAKNTYLFVPINGAGLGHLTRSLAIARRIKQQQPDAKIIFLTTSIGVMLVHRAGFVCHHVSPKVLLGESDVRWNLLFYKTLKLVLSIHRPGVLIFDGTMPYLGLRKVMCGFGSTRYVWVKRGLYKVSVNRQQLRRHIKAFDFVISPGELGEGCCPEEVDGVVRGVPPIALLDPEDLYEKDYARRVLRIPFDSVCAYVQLGAGNINGVSGLQQKVIAYLRENNIKVVVGRSPIALSEDAELLADCVIVDYPNSKYFSAFDFAVLAGGYNSVCESVMLGLPTLFVPNVCTGADDQRRRAELTAQFGPFMTLVRTDDYSIGEAVRALIAAPPAAPYQGRNGALDAAYFILGLEHGAHA
ncbi:hypothetical protein ACK8QS_09370 [Ectopseudomonas mendocina]